MAAYTLIVTRTSGNLLALGVCAAISGLAGPNPQVPPPPPPPPTQSSPSTSAPAPAAVPDEGSLPDESDTERKETEYHFNPLRAKKEFEAGMFYFHQGNFRGYRAAAPRFLEATRWNPGWAEAYLKLGEADARLKRDDEARKALAKVVELDPTSKEAKEAKKLSTKLGKETSKR